MSVGLDGQAIGLFAVTNIDALVVLAMFFGRASGRAGLLRVVAGQYLGFAAILAVSVVCALAVDLLPQSAIAYFGFIPLTLGLRAAWRAWTERHEHAEGDDEDVPGEAAGPGLLTVAGVTLANGGDNIGVYVPVFAAGGAATLATYTVVFLILVGVWCAAGYWFARRQVIARALSRWGHIILPAVLVTIGLLILIQGDAFGF